MCNDIKKIAENIIFSSDRGRKICDVIDERYGDYPLGLRVEILNKCYDLILGG